MALPGHMAGPNKGWRRLQIDQLVFVECLTGNDRRRCRNEIIERQPAQNHDAPDRGQSFSHPPATEHHHDAPKESTQRSN